MQEVEVVADASGRRRQIYDGDLMGVVSRAADRAKMGDVYAKAALTILASGHPWQKDFMRDPARRIVLRCGGRAGKTTGGAGRMARRCLMHPGSDVLFLATSRSQAEQLMWEPLKDLSDRLSVPHEAKQSKLELHYGNGSKITIGGADDKKAIEKYRGIPRHEVGIDEAASFKAQLLEWLIKRVLDTRLADYSGTLWISGTPGHVLRGTFWDVSCPGSELSRPYRERAEERYRDWRGWSMHHWNMRDAAPYVPLIANAWKETQETMAREGYTEDTPVVRREILGMWAADDAMDVFRYDPRLNAWDPPRIGPYQVAGLPDEFDDWCYALGMDLGFSDPTAITMWAFSPSDEKRRIYQVWEYERRGMYAQTIANVLLGEERNHEEPAGIYGATSWPVAAVADRDGNSSGDAILKELRLVYGIPIDAADQKNFHDSVELLNGDLLEQRCYVLKGSKLEEQMQNQQWQVDEESGKLKKHKGQRDDLTDSAIYIRRKIQSLFGSHKIEEKPDHTAAWNPDVLAAIKRNEQQDDYMGGGEYQEWDD